LELEFARTLGISRLLWRNWSLRRRITQALEQMTCRRITSTIPSKRKPFQFSRREKNLPSNW